MPSQRKMQLLNGQQEMTESTLPVDMRFQEDVLTGMDALNGASIKLKSTKCQDLWCAYQKSSKATRGFC